MRLTRRTPVARRFRRANESQLFRSISRYLIQTLSRKIAVFRQILQEVPAGAVQDLITSFSRNNRQNGLRKSRRPTGNQTKPESRRNRRGSPTIHTCQICLRTSVPPEHLKSTRRFDRIVPGNATAPHTTPPPDPAQPPKKRGCSEYLTAAPAQPTLPQKDSGHIFPALFQTRQRNRITTRLIRLQRRLRLQSQLLDVRSKLVLRVHHLLQSNLLTRVSRHATH